MTSSRHEGFSLLEIAITLVIIGVLLGGVVIGQNLVHSAKLHNVMKDIENYRTQVNNFRDQYQGWPGDIGNASTYWPACDTPATNCNGNEDTLIAWATEGFRAWQQLAAAGLIEGTYDGAPIGANAAITPHAPESGMDGLGFTFSSFSAAADVAAGRIPSLNDYFGNSLILGRATASGRTDTAGLAAEDAYAIDLKSDDGLPDSGMIYVGTLYNNCVAGVAPSITYTTANAGANCAIYVYLGR